MDENFPENAKQHFQRPETTLKLKVKKRRPSSTSSADRALKPINSPQPDVGQTKGQKRSNPFSCTPRKKANISKESRIADNFLFKALDKVDDQSREVEINKGPQEEFSFSRTELNDLESRLNLTSKDIKSSNSKETLSRPENIEQNLSTKTEQKGELHFPMDWSLKTRLRFTSSSTFSWCTTLKSKEESKGLATFVRCGDHEDNASTFKKETMVWMHPSLPWLSLFPRTSVEKNQAGKRPLFTGIQDPKILENVHQHWATSFRSVFNLVRSGYCPYFYLCANHCSMVFKAAGITEQKDVEVIISPTTKGMREALEKEGITVTMPHFSSINQRHDLSLGAASDENVQHDRDGCSGESDCDSDEECDWLDSMGLEKLKKLTRLQIRELRTLDQHPSSTVLIQGSADMQALFNYLLNCKSLIPPSGSLAGIPPTLLAPVAFDGAALQTLRVQQGLRKHQKNHGFEEVHSLEVTGPILPSCTFGLCSLLKDTQSGRYTVTTTPYQHSVAFNMKHAPTETNQVKNLNYDQSYSTFGLASKQIEYHQQNPVLSKSFLKDLSCQNGLYCWSTS